MAHIQITQNFSPAALGDQAEVYDMDELIELMHRMQEPPGVDVRTRIDVLNPYRQCFKGCDAIEFMRVQGLAMDSVHALELGTAMMNHGLIYHVFKKKNTFQGKVEITTIVFNISFFYSLTFI